MLINVHDFEAVAAAKLSQPAYDYYRGTKKGFRSLESMTQKFRWIDSRNNLTKVIDVATHKEYIGERRGLLHLLGEKLREEVYALLDEGILYFHFRVTVFTS